MECPQRSQTYAELQRALLLIGAGTDEDAKKFASLNTDTELGNFLCASIKEACQEVVAKSIEGIKGRPTRSSIRIQLGVSDN